MRGRDIYLFIWHLFAFSHYRNSSSSLKLVVPSKADTPRNSETFPACTWLVRPEGSRRPFDRCDPWRWTPGSVGSLRKESIACPWGNPRSNLDTTRFAHMILFRNKQSRDRIHAHRGSSATPFEAIIMCKPSLPNARRTTFFPNAFATWESSHAGRVIKKIFWRKYFSLFKKKRVKNSTRKRAIGNWEIVK